MRLSLIAPACALGLILAVGGLVSHLAHAHLTSVWLKGVFDMSAIYMQEAVARTILWTLACTCGVLVSLRIWLRSALPQRTKVRSDQRAGTVQLPLHQHASIGVHVVT